MWSNIKGFFIWLGEKLAGVGVFLIIIGILILAIIIAGMITSRRQDNSADKNSEIAQINKPSIGDAIEPDVNDSSNTKSETDKDSGTTAGASTDRVTEFVSPATGINPNAPIAYYNDELGFRVTLPPHAVVKEEADLVNFYSATGQLLATLNKIATQDSLADVKTQLQFSPDVKNLRDSEFAGRPALAYAVKNLSGFAIKTDNSVFYFTGQADILKQLSI